ncbi:hypothetical protein C8J56DRAFT_479015 [Mycena floridula]|nr:hypothetical protein C8J56DRAFT_479015 [Mycena floridula]
MYIDIPELLASSSLPTEAERAYLNQLLSTSNDEISRLTATIDKLVLEREALQQNVASYQAILAPIRRLPEDMLREAFVSCLPYNKATTPDVTEAPLVLGRICRSWRELSLSTPALWASIHVQFFQDFKPPQVQRLSKEASAWIARSGACPLTIRVDHGKCEDPLVIQFIESLTSLSKRWRSLEITAPAEWLVWLVSLSNSDVPQLHSFSHSVTNRLNDSQIGETLWQSMNILGADQLRDVSLTNVMLRNHVAATSKINFGQLTRLELRLGFGSTLTYAAEILGCSPNLVTCTISILLGTEPESTPRNFKSVTLLHLSSLAIEFIYSAIEGAGDLVEAFFSNLTIPRLTSFDHNMIISTSWLTVAQASPIENLAISLTNLRRASVVQYLCTSTSIKRLRFKGSHDWFSESEETIMPEPVQSLMATDIASQVICPLLEILELMDFVEEDETFVQLVRRRASLRSSDDKSRLRVVRAIFFRNVDLEVLSQLDDLVASDDFSLSISYRPGPKTDFWPSLLPDLEWPH